MKFCSQCGCAVSHKIPLGDNLPRFVCDGCQTIHYHNPKIVAGCIPEWKDHILLCRRAIEPKVGLWTFPAGFMETGESTEQAAARETFEEAHAAVHALQLHSVLSIPYISQVYIVFRGTMDEPLFKAGTESLEVKLFHPGEIPWDHLAFQVVREALRRYVQDLQRGTFSVHVDDIVPLK